MKQLYFISGTMGVGKTSVCNELKHLLSRSVFLDGDWCWDMEPFIVNDETKGMVIDNICFLLNSFIRCTELENIIFCWVMNKREIIESIINRIDMKQCQLISVSLVCSEEALTERLKRDISFGKRSPDIIERSILRLRDYDLLDTEKLDVSEMDANQAAKILAEMGKYPERRAEK